MIAEKIRRNGVFPSILAPHYLTMAFYMLSHRSGLYLKFRPWRWGETVPVSARAEGDTS